jgi:hypothetical protein
MTQQTLKTQPIPPAPGGSLAPMSLSPTQLIAPWQAGAADPWDYKKAAHLIRRAGFGGRPEEIEAMVTLGMDRCVDLLIQGSGFPILDHGVVRLPWGDYLDLATKDGQQGFWLYNMAQSPWQLQEKMALFWHDHFATGARKVTVVELMGRQINLFRTQGMGFFGDLLTAVSRDPAMLHWLDNWVNTAAAPQENYGREIMELFSMGVDGGYTQADVRAATRAFTGWTLPYEMANAFLYDDRLHDYGPKQFLGITIQNPPPYGERDGLDVIARILQMPATARYLVKKLLAYFVLPQPPQGVVDLLAQQFRGSGYDVAALMSTILRSTLFHGSTAFRSLIKSPMEHMIGTMRTLGIVRARYGPYVSTSPGGLTDRIRRQGFDLLNYPDPSGFNEGPAWLTSSTVSERCNATLELVQTSGSALTPLMDPFREIRRVGLTTANQVVDHYLKIMLDDDLPATIRTAFYSYMITRDSGPYAFSTTSQQAVNDKVRGLIHLITLLPEYFVN